MEGKGRAKGMYGHKGVGTPVEGIKNFGKKFLNFSLKREEPGEQKPIIWASKYEQYVQEKKQKEEERNK
eukprot:1140171-Pelagomonas_calceolata.AAC.1